MDNNSCILVVLFEKYMLYCFKIILYCRMLIRKIVVFVVDNLMYLLYFCVVIINGTFICEFMKLV
jgi:hypothetical protein